MISGFTKEQWKETVHFMFFIICPLSTFLYNSIINFMGEGIVWKYCNILLIHS